MDKDVSPLAEAAEAGTDAHEVSIIVVSYNTRDMTIDCLRSVFEQTSVPFELIVVDNASSDGSAKAIARAFPAADYPNMQLLAEDTNHGFAPAHRIAMEHARARYILLLNPDTVVLDDAVGKVLRFARERPDAGIWGGRTLFGDRSLNPTSCFGRMTLWSVFCRLFGLNAVFRSSEIFNSEFFGDWKRDTKRSVDIVTGCFFLIERHDWDRLGGFDDLFTMYGEEVDLCLRAKEIGLKPAITPDATIIHYGGQSETIRANRQVMVMRAKIELITKHFPAGQRWLGRAMFRLIPGSRGIIFGLAGRALSNDGLRERGAIWWEVWQRRREWQRGFSGSQ